MSQQIEIPIPPQPVLPPTLDQLRRAAVAAQKEAVIALRQAEENCGELLGSDELEMHWCYGDDCRAHLATSRRIINDDVTQDDAGYDEPTLDQVSMLVAIKHAEGVLDRFDSAINALRAREIAELVEAGAVPRLPSQPATP